MKLRIAMAVSAGLVALLAASLALSGNSSIESVAATTSTTAAFLPESQSENGQVSIPSIPPGAIPLSDGAHFPIQVGHAGSVVVMRNGDLLKVLSATPYEGWTSEVRMDAGREVLGYFWSETLGFEFNLELENGAVSYQLKPIVIETIASTTAAQVQPTSTVTPATTSPPIRSTTTATTAATTAPATTAPATTTTTQPTTTTEPVTTTTEPPPTTTAPTTTRPGVWTQIALTSEGGLIAVSYRNGEVRLDAISPAPNFEVKDIDEDRRRVRVEFEGEDVTYILRAEWTRGELVTVIDEKGKGGDDDD